MNIGIDGYFMVGKKTGMGHVLYNILINFSEQFTHENNIKVYIPQRMNDNEESKIKANNIDLVLMKKSVFPIWEQFDLKRAADKDKIDIFWFPFNTGCINMNCKRIVTIHDVIYIKTDWKGGKTLYKKLGALYRKKVVPIITKKCDKIITVSKFSLEEIAEVLGNDVKNKAHVVYNSVSFNDPLIDDNDWLSFCNNNSINSKYILAPGSIEKRKNTINVIKAYQGLPDKYKKKYKLVLYGFKEWDVSEEKKYIENNHINGIISLRYISNEILSQLYSYADIFVFASTYEGFGIPIIEAMYYGTPVITSNITCLPEIAGDAALFVDPYNINDIIEKIKSLIDDPNQAKKLIIKGEENIHRFSWKISSKNIEKIFSDM